MSAEFMPLRPGCTQLIPKGLLNIATNVCRVMPFTPGCTQSRPKRSPESPALIVSRVMPLRLGCMQLSPKGFLNIATNVCRFAPFDARLYAISSPKGRLDFAIIVCRVMPSKPGYTQKAWPTTFCLRLAPYAAGGYHRIPPCLTTADLSESTAACQKVTRCVPDDRAAFQTAVLLALQILCKYRYSPVANLPPSPPKQSQTTVHTCIRFAHASHTVLHIDLNEALYIALHALLPLLQQGYWGNDACFLMVLSNSSSSWWLV